MSISVSRLFDGFRMLLLFYVFVFQPFGYH